MNSFRQLASHSDNTCSPAYFWFFNDDVPRQTIREQLQDMVDHGLKAILLHPMPYNFRPVTMMTRMSPDYLTPEYFELCRYIMDEAQKLGLHYWLYDEGGWPSGGACTLVSHENPRDFRPVRLTPQDDGTIAPAYVGEPKPGFYPGLLNPGVTDTFIRLTHDQYFQTSPQHFGSTIRLAFQDEASFGPASSCPPDLETLFLERKGYDLKPYYPHLLDMPDEQTPEDVLQARIDFADLRSQLFVERFVKPIQDWCHAHGILSSGHFNIDHEPRGNGSANGGHGHLLRALRHLDVPGIDVIWRQLFPGIATHHFPKYASSIARQHGHSLAMSESAAVYGNGLTPQQLKWLIDYQAVRGITMFVISAYPMSLKDPFLYTSTRPSFGPVNPLWKYSRLWHDHITRLCALLRAGKPDCHTAVFFDVRSIWVGGPFADRAILTHDTVAQTLLEHHADFDFVDDDALASATLDTTVTPPALKIGAMTYTHLVLPACNRMAPEARQQLDAFRQAGGIVLDEHQLEHIRPVASLQTAARTPARQLRLTKRRLDTQTAYFIINEEDTPCEALLSFPETTPCLLFDTATGDTMPLAQQPDHSYSWHFPPLSSACFIFGEQPSKEPEAEFTPCQRLTPETWTLQPRQTYTLSADGVSTATLPDATPQTVSLGDWRPVLGDYFSGDARYRCTFDNPGCTRAKLDLGDVRYACTVRCNGIVVAELAWPPYVCHLDKALQAGQNILEIDVTNTLGNALSDPHWPEIWRQKFPQAITQYDEKERAAERDTLSSGLYGPVSIDLAP